MHNPTVHHLLPQRQQSATLVACSICLRVRRRAGWVAPERVIRELRSFELGAPPRLLPGLCSDCCAQLRARRVQLAEPAAA